MSAPSYESYCTSCQVSHPPRTRRCLHCGGEVMKERPAHVGTMRQGEETTFEDLLQPESERPQDEEESAPRKAPGGMRVAISLLWIAFAIGISIYRGCQGGS